ncbi:LysR family transcriptional regulator [Herbaspirillum sp. WKF16]|jgi:DNA-binding transcriptional LysR family regulator|uniref:LysR family transcriptional regulator n=1 Tax=Herbaspirillum sp. WKF16 TaxID=3028312 RepID=UPI0023A9B5E7|nr:LysR family transcriptional regulator [Herbaspirillum sp. WKF16]WDZ97033.1 LysR family transcriptional regulator [Herbaspirillum sp. WKF16]
MELRQLRQFVAVAEEKSFTRAAQRCHIVQSALSSSIRLLEDELGAPLFVRTTRHVALTAAGEAFLESARRALGVLEQGATDVADVNALRRGRLAIGTVQSLPSFIDLPAVLARFHRRHPGVEVRLCQGAAGELNEKVASRQLDLAILPIEESGEGLQTQIVACEDLVLACVPSHRLAGARSVTLEQLAAEEFVDFEQGRGTRMLVDRGFAEAGLRRRLAFEVSDLETLLDLVCHGLGVALLPRDVVLGRRGKLACVNLRGVELCWELVVTHKAAGRGGAAVLDAAPAAFLELLMAQAHAGESAKAEGKRRKAA